MKSRSVSRPKTTARPKTTPKKTGAAAKPKAGLKKPTSPTGGNKINKTDKVSLGKKEQAPRSDFVNPLNNMFSESKTSSAHAEGDLSKGKFDVGAEASSSKTRQSSTDDGVTRVDKSKTGEAHAKVAASGDLSKGQLSTELDVGASAQESQSGLKRGETEVGGVKLRGEAGGSVSASAEAGLRSRTDINLSEGKLDHESRAAIGVNGKVNGHVASEVEAFGVTRRDELRAGAEVDAHASSENKVKIDDKGVDVSTRNEAQAKLAADVAAKTEYSSDAGSVSAEARGEASVFAEAHANGRFKSTEDELTLGGSVGASAAAQLAGEGTLHAETRNGSQGTVNAGVNTGSVGFNIGGEVSRKKGQTSIGLETGGGLALVGGHFNANATIADRDIAEGAAAPLTGGAAVYNALGDGADVAERFTDSARQSAQGRQQFIQQMGEVPTGNFIADTGIAAAEKVHGAYTGATEFADTFAEEAGRAYHQAGDNLSRTAGRVADTVERKVGETMDYGVKKVHSGYQYGRAVGGGFVQGLGQGARNIGNFFNPWAW